MINLLPPEIKQKRHAKSHLYAVTVFYITGLAIIVLGSAALLTYNLTMHSTIDGLNGQIQTLARQRVNQDAVISQAAFLEDRIKNVGSYHESAKWDDILDQIAQATPTDTQITDIKMSQQTDKGTVFTLTGSTATRRSIVLFADKLNENKSFTNATISSITESNSTASKTFQFVISLGLTTPSK